MSVEIRMSRGLRAHVDVPPAVAVEGASAREAVDALAACYPELRRFVLDDAQRLRRHVNIYINDALILDRDHLSDPLADGDRLYILPAVSGGAPQHPLDSAADSASRGAGRASHAEHE